VLAGVDNLTAKASKNTAFASASTAARRCLGSDTRGSSRCASSGQVMRMRYQLLPVFVTFIPWYRHWQKRLESTGGKSRLLPCTSAGASCSIGDANPSANALKGVELLRQTAHAYDPATARLPRLLKIIKRRPH
jgi:hypothetical protein